MRNPFYLVACVVCTFFFSVLAGLSVVMAVKTAQEGKFGHVAWFMVLFVWNVGFLCYRRSPPREFCREMGWSTRR